MIVAEIGINHMGSEEYAETYIGALLKSKVDAITFQVRESEFYKKKKWQSFYLCDDFYKKIISQISGKKKVGIAISDIKKIDFFESLGVDFYKILSRDLSNKKLIEKILDTSKEVYVSTGVSTITDIKKMLKRSKKRKNQITLIHTQLTHKIDLVNLKMIEVMKKELDRPVGFGNHCQNLNVLYAAVSFQPSDFFVYVKGNKRNFDKHPDEEHAISIYSIDNFIKNILELSQAVGTGVKSDMKNQIKGME